MRNVSGNVCAAGAHEISHTTAIYRAWRALVGIIGVVSLLFLMLGAQLAHASAATKNVLPVAPLPGLPSIPATVQPVSPFTIVGFIQKATLNAPSDPVAGGVLVVNGQRVKVTANTAVAMPGTILQYQELFSLAPKPWGPSETGMALSDYPKPLTTYEAMVQGNRTITNGRDEYDAGLIFIWQQSTNTGQGFINYIDYTTGELRIGGALNDATTGARVRLNDPLGRFGRAMSPDRRFSIDENNPTVRTATGYPMCIPRVNLTTASATNPVADDPLCPQINRPKDTVNGGFLRQIFMQPAPCSSFALSPTGTPSVSPPNCTLNAAPDAPDATKQMPFEVGDYVTFQGSLVTDTTSSACIPAKGAFFAPPNPACEYISAWSVIANIGAFTAPGTMPAYVAIDVAQMGTGGIPNVGLPQEATANVKVEGFTTDPTEPVDVFGIDIDACSGASRDRYWGTQPVLQIGQLGRFRFIPLGGTFTPPVREVRAVSQTLSNGAIPASISSAKTFANGLIAGQYDAPITRFIFPEIAEVGLTEIPLNLDDFPFLAEGFMGARCSASLTPATLNFADLAPGATSAPQTVTLTNTGIGALNIAKVSISDSFSQNNTCGTQLATGASCTFSVAFKAGTQRIQTGVLEVTDTATGGPQRVSLIGTVAQPAVATFVPPSLNFADQAPGTMSAAQMVTLTNTGGADLKISSVGVSVGYSQTNRCPMTLKPGGSCVFNVRLDPMAVGALSGTLRINDNSAGAPHTVALRGMSSDFTLSAARAWANVAAGETAVYGVNVAGTELASGTVSLSCSDVPAGSQCTISPPTVNLHGAQMQPLTVRVTTSAGANLNARSHGAPGALPFTLTLLSGAVGAVFTRKRAQKVVLGVVAFCALMLNGCGGGNLVQLTGGSKLAQSPSSQVSVTAVATNGAIHTLRLALQIKPSPKAPLKAPTQPRPRTPMGPA